MASSSPSPPTASVAGGAAAAASSARPPDACHRGDPLDVPLIDDHLLSRLLLPRIANAIKLAFPRAHLDWTTGVVASNSDGRSDTAGDNGAIKNALIWKKIIEGVLRTLLLVGSCHRFIGNRSNSVEGGVCVRTPAMRSLGMSIRPSKHNGVMTSLIRAYGKVAALVIATVIVPSLYEELKRRRERQLEERERRLRMEEIRREVRASMGQDQPSVQQLQSTQRPRTQLSLMQQRARERRSRLQSLLADTILGMGDVFLPPLRLLSYVSYLWGMGSTPSLGMQLAGWEYAADNNTAGTAGNVGPDSGDYFGARPHNRHANFQYGNRRLMVEEALRTVSMVLPPRDNIDGGGADGGAAPVTERGVVGNGRGGDGLGAGMSVQQAGQPNSSVTQRTVNNKRGYMRKRFLSFMGVVDEDDSPASLEDARQPLPCSLCHVEHPTVPYVASCGHCYCYLCLRTAVTDDLGFRCADCGKAIVSSARRKCPRP